MKTLLLSLAVAWLVIPNTLTNPGGPNANRSRAEQIEINSYENISGTSCYRVVTVKGAKIIACGDFYIVE